MWPLERVSHSCEPMVLSYEPGAGPTLVSLSLSEWYGAGEWTPFPPFWSQSYACLSDNRYGAGEWTAFYFTLPRERTRPLGEDVRGFQRFVY